MALTEQGAFEERAYHGQAHAAADRFQGRRRISDLFFRAVLGIVCACACVFSLTLAAGNYLARQQTVASITRASRLLPFDADYLISLAELKPQESGALLRQAAERNPYIADVWIRLGLQAEMQSHDIAGAEREYRKASQYDHTYMPLWTLASFYLRQHDRNKFLPVARSALEITPYESAPVFSEEYALGLDNDEIMRLIPQRPEIAFGYLQFVLASNRSDALEPAVLRAASFRAPIGRDESGQRANWTSLLGVAGDRLIALNHLDPAVRVWKRMHDAGWVSLPAPSVATPLTNASFRVPISGHGFDWLLYPVPGVTADQMPESQKLRFSLSGAQPEQCRLMQQVLVLRPGREYRFKWQAESSDFQGTVGLTWKLLPLFGGSEQDILTSPDLFSAGGRGEWAFTSPSRTDSFLLTLELKRPLGQVRAEGAFAVSDLSLVSAPPAGLEASNSSLRGVGKP
jgi:tetratricopeptide (TPR) repeat protein